MPEIKETPLTDEVQIIFKKLGKKALMKIAHDAFQAAMKEFLEEVFARFGRWTFFGVSAMFLSFLVGVAVFGYAWLNGWRPH